MAERRFEGSLAGTLTVTAGLGGMGGAQPLAITMNGGVALVVECDPARIRRRLETRDLDEHADDLDDAIARREAARRERRGASGRGGRNPPRGAGGPGRDERAAQAATRGDGSCRFSLEAGRPGTGRRSCVRERSNRWAKR